MGAQAGAAGTNGTNGTNGLDGLTGLTGATGPAGSTGETGPVGPQGTPGTGFTFRGAFNPSNNYALNDVVTFTSYSDSGSTWIATAAIPAFSAMPGVSPWQKLAASGKGFNNRGAWNAGNGYSAFDVVTYNGFSYLCIANGGIGGNFSNLSPGLDTGNWAGLGGVGPQGLPGINGLNGTNGIQGIQGIPGINGTNGVNGTNGASFTWQGTWNSATNYNVNDTVSFNGSSYVAIQAGAGQQPDLSSSPSHLNFTLTNPMQGGSTSVWTWALPTSPTSQNLPSGETFTTTNLIGAFPNAFEVDGVPITYTGDPRYGNPGNRLEFAQSSDQQPWSLALLNVLGYAPFCGPTVWTGSPSAPAFVPGTYAASWGQCGIQGATLVISQPTAAPYWNLVAQAGTNGTNGTNGINGTNGLDGINGTNGLPGATGSQGPQGVPGAPAVGAGTMYYSAKFGSGLPVQSMNPGDSDSTLATLNLPSGTYLIQATATFANTGSTVSQVGCTITPAFGTGGPQTSNWSGGTIPLYLNGAGGSTTFTVQGVEVNQASVSLLCSANGYAAVSVGSVTMVATQQGSVVLQ
jgi:hypothetical protein